jgi:hypothetical protein
MWFQDKRVMSSNTAHLPNMRIDRSKQPGALLWGRRLSCRTAPNVAVTEARLSHGMATPGGFFAGIYERNEEVRPWEHATCAVGMAAVFC